MSAPTSSGSAGARSDEPLAAAVAANMTPLRFWLANGIAITLVAVQAFEILADREHWPFSQYPMYSTLEPERSISAFRLTGILAGRDGAEIPLQSTEYLYPFDQSRLGDGLGRATYEPDAGARIADGLSNVLRHYEERRRKGEHSGPELSGIRFYKTKHTLQPGAKNLEHPEVRELLGEVKRSVPSP